MLAINLVGWPRDVLDLELLAEVLRGGADVAREAGCPVAGGHSIDDPEPKYGMAVTGIADPDRLLRNDAARAGLPLTLTKPLGVGVLNNRHKATGEVFPQAVATMVALNARGVASGAGGRGRRPRPTSPASGCSATCTRCCGPPGWARGSTSRRCRYSTGRAMPCATGSSAAAPAATSTGCGRTSTSAPGSSDDDLLLLADAQTSGGLLVVGEVPGGVVIGETVAGPARIALS